MDATMIALLTIVNSESRIVENDQISGEPNDHQI